MRENLNSNIKLKTTRKLSLFYGGLPGRELKKFGFLLNQETRLDVILVRLHFSRTLPQARQLISHRKVCVNNGLVRITHWKVSHGDLISFPENEARSGRSEEIKRSFYIDILVGKIIGKSRPVRLWRRTKIEWFRLLKTKRKCRLLLKSRFLQELRSSMQKEDLERTKKFGSAKVCLGSSFAEHNRMKRNLFHFKYYFLLAAKDQNLPTPFRCAPFVDKSSFYKKSTYCYGSPFTRKIRIKRIELPTHYSEVNHRTLKAVVSYGPNIGHIPHDIRLKDLNLLLWSGNGRGQNI
jgi:small subunit ribosomal protein S4